MEPDARPHGLMCRPITMWEYCVGKAALQGPAGVPKAAPRLCIPYMEDVLPQKEINVVADRTHEDGLAFLPTGPGSRNIRKLLCSYVSQYSPSGFLSSACLSLLSPSSTRKSARFSHAVTRNPRMSPGTRKQSE
jgi:hypothetical protein